MEIEEQRVVPTLLEAVARLERDGIIATAMADKDAAKRVASSVAISAPWLKLLDREKLMRMLHVSVCGCTARPGQR